MSGLLAHVIISLQFFLFCFASDFVKVDRPLGVSLTRKGFYDPGKDFTCLDGTQTIRFSMVNDDYCDCGDGSDEPGTSACPNGSFHCTNAGYRPRNIPSSRVNDGICDCCDGSDEWKDSSFCANTCIELRRVEMEVMKKEKEESLQGMARKEEYAKSGQNRKQEREEELKQLQTKLAELQSQESKMKDDKVAVEALEAAALAKHKEKMEEKQEQIRIQEDIRKGQEAFTEMDLDKDASVTIHELAEHHELDPDSSDGQFKEEEAQALLQAYHVDLQTFMEKIWPVINETFITSLLPPKENVEEPTQETQDEDQERQQEEDRQLVDGDQEPSPEELDSEYEEESDDDDDDQDREEDYEDDNKQEVQKQLDEEYDEATRNIVDEANQARQRYEVVEKEKKKIESDIESVNKALALDFGPDQSFQVMQFQCYELLTMEYKYKLCPFDQATQSPINGGSETSLGRWGRWSGGAGNLYSKMKYENGLTCWNGPARSTEVVLKCGLEHRLLSVDEPSRCAYRYEFATPCACSPVDHHDSLPRDEL